MHHRAYHNYPKYWNRHVWANGVDPDQMLQNLASDQGIHCLPLIRQYLHTLIDSKNEHFQILGEVW